MEGDSSAFNYDTHEPVSIPVLVPSLQISMIYLKDELVLDKG
jgi:hypothetical protein